MVWARNKEHAIEALDEVGNAEGCPIAPVHEFQIHFTLTDRGELEAACRTALLGGHRETCDHCGATGLTDNSCRNRHCPTCQSQASARWMEARRADLPRKSSSRLAAPPARAGRAVRAPPTPHNNPAPRRSAES